VGSDTVWVPWKVLEVIRAEYEAGVHQKPSGVVRYTGDHLVLDEASMADHDAAQDFLSELAREKGQSWLKRAKW